MLTDILILDCKQTIHGYASIKYIIINNTISTGADTTNTPTWTARTAITTLKNNAGHLLSPGICYSVEIGLTNEPKPTISWRQPIPLPIDFYLPALLSILKNLPISVDIEIVQAKLSSLGKFPQLLARLLDPQDSEMLEGYLDYHHALKVHNAWKIRRTLEESMLHLAHLTIPENLAKVLCRVQYPLTREVTHQRLALNIQNKLLADPLSGFYDETRIILHLTWVRSRGVTLIALPDIKKTLGMAANNLEKAIHRLECNLTIRKIGSYVILTTDYFTEVSIHKALVDITKNDYLPFFFSYEIEECIERVERLAGTHITKDGKAVLKQSLHNRISTLYTASPRILLAFLDSLSQTYQTLLNLKPTIILPSPLTSDNEIQQQASLISLSSLHNMLPLRNQLVIALDADTYTKAELLTVLQSAGSGTRILFHATSHPVPPSCTSRAQLMIARAHPFINTADMPLITSRKTTTVNPATRLEHAQHIHHTQHTERTKIFFNKSKYLLLKLAAKTDSILLVPSQNLALKLNRKLHRMNTRPGITLVKTSKYSFCSGDRIIFYKPSPNLAFERYPIGILRAAQDERILIDFNGELTVISAQAFLASAPTPCYALSLEQFKNMHIAKSIVLAPNPCDGSFLNAAYTRSERVVGVFYGVARLRVAMSRRLPIDEQTMLDIVPRLI